MSLLCKVLDTYCVITSEWRCEEGLISPFYGRGTRTPGADVTRTAWLVWKNVCSQTLALCSATNCCFQVLASAAGLPPVQELRVISGGVSWSQFPEQMLLRSAPFPRAAAPRAGGGRPLGSSGMRNRQRRAQNRLNLNMHFGAWETVSEKTFWGSGVGAVPSGCGVT